MDQVLDHDMFARRTKSEGACVFENVPAIFQFRQIPLINFVSLALEIGTVLSAFMRSFIPVQSKPAQPLVDGSSRFLRVPRLVGVFDSKNKRAPVMPGKKPVEQGRSRSANMQITRRRRRKTNANGTKSLE